MAVRRIVRIGAWVWAAGLLAGCIEVVEQPLVQPDVAEEDVAEEADVADGPEGGGPDVAAEVEVSPSAEDIGGDVPGEVDVAREVESEVDVEPEVDVAPDVGPEVDVAPDAEPSVCDELACDDGDPCTLDWCDAELGCQVGDDDGVACEDGNPCTVQDSCAFGQCQPGQPRLWDQLYGGPTNDVAYDAAVLADGSIAVAGTASAGPKGLDAWWMRLDEAGEIVWKKQHGGDGDDVAAGVAAHPDGGMVLAGQLVVEGEPRLWARRVDAGGALVWEYLHEPEGEGRSGAAGVAILEGGDAAVVGWRAADDDGPTSLLVLRLSDAAEGGLAWYNAHSGAADVAGTGVTVTGGGLIAASGLSVDGSGWTHDGLVLAWAADGDSAPWHEQIGGDDADEVLYGVAARDGGGVIAAGSTNAGGEGVDGWLVWTDAAGEVLGQATTNPAPVGDSHLRSICRLADGTFGVGGLWGNPSGHNDPAWLGRVDGSGQELWSQPAPVAVQFMTFDYAWGCAGAADGGVIFVGERTQVGAGDALVNDPFVRRTDPEGKTFCQ